jgi:hypothetical protein
MLRRVTEKMALRQLTKTEKDFLETLEEVKIIEKRILSGIDYRTFYL